MSSFGFCHHVSVVVPIPQYPARLKSFKRVYADGFPRTCGVGRATRQLRYLVNISSFTV